MADVLKQNVERLEQLHTHVAARLLTQDIQEEGKHVLFKEEAEHTDTCRINGDLLKHNCKKKCFMISSYCLVDHKCQPLFFLYIYHCHRVTIKNNTDQ